MTVCLPVWNSHCTRVRFTVIMLCSDQGRIRGGDRPLKTYESNIFHHDFVQFRKTLGCQRRLDSQILLKSPLLNLRAGSAPGSDELAVHSCPLLCLHRRLRKSRADCSTVGLYCVTNMATYLQRFILYYGSRRFVAWDCCTHTSWDAGDTARQWHADSGKPRAFILCEKKHEWVYSSGS